MRCNSNNIKIMQTKSLKVKIFNKSQGEKFANSIKPSFANLKNNANKNQTKFQK